MALGDARIAPGAPGPGRHVHTNEDEGVYVVQGTLTVQVGDLRFQAGPECFVFMPRGVPHVFENLSDSEVWPVGLLNPPGLEDMFAEQAAYVDSLQGPPDPAFSSSSAPATASIRSTARRSRDPTRWPHESQQTA